MFNDTHIRTAATDETVDRLRGFLAGSQPLALAAFEQHIRSPRYRPAFTQVLITGETPVGYAFLQHQRLALEGVTIDVGLIETITLGEAQEQLYDELFGACLQALQEEGLPIVRLRAMTPAIPYGLAAYHFQSQVMLREAVISQQLARLRAAGPEDIDNLSALYRYSYRQIPFAEMRAVPDWQALLRTEVPLLVLEDIRGRLVAYGKFAAGESAMIDEAAATDVGTARMLLAALQSRQQGNHLQLMLPARHAVAQAALLAGGGLQLSVAPASADTTLDYVGIVDLRAALEQCIPVFERRLERSRYADWNGNLCFEVEGERATLIIHDGHILVTNGAQPAAIYIRRVLLPAFAQLLFGYRTAADLRDTNELDCDDTAIGLMDILFPSLL